MNRSDIIENLTAKFDKITKSDAELAVSAILEAMNQTLAAKHRIEIRDFGSFSVRQRPSRMGRNPRSGENVAIPETRAIHFKTGKGLREAVDKPKARGKAHPAK